MSKDIFRFFNFERKYSIPQYREVRDPREENLSLVNKTSYFHHYDPGLTKEEREKQGYNKLVAMAGFQGATAGDPDDTDWGECGMCHTKITVPPLCDTEGCELSWHSYWNAISSDRCSRCNSVVGSDSTWRRVDEHWQHRCADVDPRVGHWSFPEDEPALPEFDSGVR